MKRRGRVLLAGVALLLCPAGPSAAGEPAAITFAAALESALSNSLALRNAGLEVEKTRRLKSSVERERLPEFTLNGSYSRFDLPAVSDVPIPGFSLPDSEADLSLSGTLPLYTGGRISSARRLAAGGLAAEREAERAVRQDTILGTAAGFYELYAAQRLLEISTEAFESSRRHLADVEALLAEGLVAGVDLYRTELDVAERERDLAAAEANLRRRAEALSALLYPDRYVEVRAAWEGSAPEEIPGVEAWMSLAEENAPEILSAALARDLAGEAVAGARAERLPKIGLFGAYGAKDEDFSLGDDALYWNAGVALTVPLFRGGRTTMDIESAADGRRQAVNALVLARRRVRGAIVDAHAGVRLALEQYRTAQRSIRAAGENLRVTELKYREGLVPNTDVIDALLFLSRARFNEVEALKNFHRDRARLMRSAGTIEELL